MTDFVHAFAELAAGAAGLDPSEIVGLVAAPRDHKRYTYALPCFLPAKKAGRKPPELARAVAAPRGGPARPACRADSLRCALGKIQLFSQRGRAGKRPRPIAARLKSAERSAKPIWSAQRARCPGPSERVGS